MSITPHRELRICAVDDHPVMLLGILYAAQGASAAMTLVHAATTVSQLLEKPPECDVVLLDLRLGDDSRPRDNVRRLLAQGYRVLVFTEGHPQEWVREAVAAGAHGVVLKSQPPEQLLLALNEIVDGDMTLSPAVASILRTESTLRPHLSAREEETLRYVAAGLATKQIAGMMNVKEETVKQYLKRVRSKYDDLGRAAPSRIALHQRAIEDGFVTDD